jgi:hypothetical protein
MTNNVTSWVKQNLWGIILFVGMFIAGYATLNAKVNAMEKQLSLYPSQDYFELKFNTIDDKLIELNDKLSSHLNQK